jgi:hypothetical protein
MRPKPSGAPLTSHQIQPRIRGPSVHRSCRLEASGTTVAFLRCCEQQVTPSRQSDGAPIVTSGSSGHLIRILDTRYCEFAQKLGVERTRLVAQGSAEAIEQIAELVERLHIECFDRGPTIHRAGRTCGQPGARPRALRARGPAGNAAGCTAAVRHLRRPACGWAGAVQSCRVSVWPRSRAPGDGCHSLN